jgi:hypothetical protein
LAEAAAGRRLIVTSALTIAEVLAMRGKKPIPKSEREKVKAFFRNAYIYVYNVTRHIAEDASLQKMPYM